MADFDAGSIESQLTVDRSPFTRGLELAREQAEDFEDQGINISIDVDDGDALVAFDDVEMRADELDGREVNVRVNVDNDEADRRLDETRDKVDGGDGRGGIAGAFALLGSATGPLRGGLLAGGVLTGLAGLEGLLGATSGAALGLGGALSIAAAGLIPFGLVAKSDFTDMQASLKDLTKQQQALNTATTDAQRQAALKAIAADTKALQGPAGLAAAAFQSMQSSLAKLKTDTGGSVYGTLGSFFTLGATVLPKLAPLIQSTAEALSGVAGQLSLAFSSDGFQKFLTFLSTNVGPVFAALGTTFTNFGGGFAAALEKLQPLIDPIVHGLLSISGTFDKFAESPAFDNLVNTLVSLMPQVGATLSAIAEAISSVVGALGPAIGPALDLITNLAVGIAQLAPILSPLVTAFVTLLDKALTPIIPILVQLVGTLVPPLVGLLGDIAPILPLIAQAFADLVVAVLPLVPLFGQMVSLILPPLVNFLEILIKQGIGPLIVALVNSLAPVLPKIADAFSKLLTAVAPLIPTLIQAFIPVLLRIIPQLPGLVIGFTGLAIALTNMLVAIPPSTWTFLIQSLEYLANPVVIQAVIMMAEALTGIVNAITGLAKIIGGAQNDIHNFFANIGPNILKAVAGAGTWLLNTGGAIIGGLLSGIETAWGTVSLWWNNVKGWISGAFSGAISWLYDAGKNTLMGLLSGIQNGLGQVVTWVKDHLGSSIVGAVKTALHISSPSRLMADEVGKYIPLGIAAGIDENMNAVKNSMARVAGIASGEFNSSANFSLRAIGTVSPGEQAQMAALTAVVAQLSDLVNTTKDLPAAIGEQTATQLSPVLGQQTVSAHQYALQRGRAGALGVGGDGS